MKIDFTKPILDRRGEPLQKEQEEPLQLSDVIIVAIDQADDKIEAKEKYRRGRLADRIYGTKEPIELPAEDIALLKELVGRRFNPLIVARAWDILDPKGE